jgi:hypothetical protein
MKQQTSPFNKAVSGSNRPAMSLPAQEDALSDGSCHYISVVVRSAAVLALDGRHLGVRIASDELGFERVKLADIDDNYTMLSAWFAGTPKPPVTSILMKAFLHADQMEQRKHSNSTRLTSQTLWAKYEADKFHLLCTYVLRCWRRSQKGARSIALARLKLLLDKHGCSEGDAETPTTAAGTSDAGSDMLPYPGEETSDCDSSSDSEQDRPSHCMS